MLHNVTKQICAKLHPSTWRSNGTTLYLATSLNIWGTLDISCILPNHHILSYIIIFHKNLSYFNIICHIQQRVTKGLLFRLPIIFCRISKATLPDTQDRMQPEHAVVMSVQKREIIIHTGSQHHGRYQIMFLFLKNNRESEELLISFSSYKPPSIE